jgi:hypothetical protein
VSQTAVAFLGPPGHVQSLDQESIVGHHFCRISDSHILDPDMSYLFALPPSADLHDLVRECCDISDKAEVGVLDVSQIVAELHHLQ